MATAISQFRNKIIPHVQGCPFPSIDDAVREAAIQFCEDTHILEKSFEVEEFDYTTIDDADNDAITIDLTTYFTGYIPIKLTRLQYNGADCEAKHMILDNDNSNLSTILVSGTYFFNFPSTTTLKMFPFTNVSSDFDLFIKMVVKPVSTATTLDDILYEDWRKAIWAKAKSELQRIPSTPWTDLVQAGINEKEYSGYMGDAKIRVSDGFVKGSETVTGSYF